VSKGEASKGEIISLGEHMHTSTGRHARRFEELVARLGAT
jgi:hypothetical protein